MITPANAALAVLVMLIWGFNFAFCKYGLLHLPPLFFTTLRFLVSFLVLCPFFSFPRLRLKILLLLSVTFGFAHFGLFFMGLSRGMQAGTASILLQAGPAIAVLLGVVWLKEKVSRLQVAGLCLAATGVVIVVGLPEEPPELIAAILLLVAAAAWAVSTLIMKGLNDIHPLGLMCWLSFFTTLVVGLLWVVVEGATIPDAPYLAYASVFYPAILSTVVAYGLWNYLLRKAPVTQLAPFGLMAPFFGVAGGVLVLGEAVSWIQIGGGILLIAGVFCSSVLPQILRARADAFRDLLV